MKSRRPGFRTVPVILASVSNLYRTPRLVVVFWATAAAMRPRVRTESTSSHSFRFIVIEMRRRPARRTDGMRSAEGEDHAMKSVSQVHAAAWCPGSLTREQKPVERSSSASRCPSPLVWAPICAVVVLSFYAVGYSSTENEAKRAFARHFVEVRGRRRRGPGCALVRPTARRRSRRGATNRRWSDSGSYGRSGRAQVRDCEGRESPRELIVSRPCRRSQCPTSCFQTAKRSGLR